jgi:internalin A
MDLRPLAKLTTLQALNLSDYRGLTDLGPLAKLTALQYLDLAECAALTNLGPLAKLTALQSLNLSGCAGLTDLGPLAKLTALQSLYLSRCAGLTDLGPLARLTALHYLYLSGCAGLTDLGPLAKLTALRSLILSLCEGLADLGPLAKLTALQDLGLSACAGLRCFGRLSELLPTLNKLVLYGCSFDDLPEELCGESLFENVLDKVRAHFADLERGFVEDAELKLFVLGNGGVGKTQLCRRLRLLPYDDTISSTHGVQLGHFDLPIEGRPGPVRIRFWDFGGQDIYHGTHALFLQGHAVFVVLWTPDREDGEADEGGVPIRHRPLAYWLDYIRGLAGTDSPVLVVQAQCDEPRQRRTPPRVPSDDFRYLKFLEFSARTDLGLDVLTAHVKEGVRNLLAARPLHQIGAGRAEVRARLGTLLDRDQARPPAKRKHRMLTQDEYRAICTKTGKVANPDALLDYLHHCGVVFHRPGLFENRIILDQAWCLDAIYTLFHRQRTLPFLCRDGRFTRPMLAHLVWQNYSEQEQETFLGMMQSCGICFRTRNLSGDRGHPEWEYIAPDLLPGWSGVQELLRGRLQDAEPAAGATVRYAFLHEGILRTFLARIGQQAQDAAVYWKYGCWFWEETTHSGMLIRTGPDAAAGRPGAGEVTLSAWGDGADRLVSHVLETLLRIPVGQPPEVSRTAGRREGPGRDEERPAGVEALVMSPRSHLPAGETRRVFISYAWGDDSPQGRERGQVVERLCERLRAWGYQVIRDRDQMRSGDHISAFMKLIGQGDRVVVILSEKYLRSVYCMTELHGIFEHSRGARDDFLGRIIPLTLADAHIAGIRDRADHARHWKAEKEALQADVADGLLGASDYKQWQKMSRWASEVGEMLAYIADMLHPVGFEQIVANDFAAVQDRLQRG